MFQIAQIQLEEMDNKPIKKRKHQRDKLKSKRCNKESGDYGGRGNGGRGDQMNEGEGFFNTFGLSPFFLKSLNINGPLHNRIFVTNLDDKVNEKKLKDVLGIAGNLVGIELCRKEDGKSKGFAHVVYDHPVEAVQAISMFHNQQLFDKKMIVKFDKVTIKKQPRNPSRLPEGLMSVGMGLGENGMPLLDVRANLPSSDMGNISLGQANLGVGEDNVSAGGNQGNDAATVASAALQAALTTIREMGAQGGNNGGNNMGAIMGGVGDSGINMGSSRGMGMINTSGEMVGNRSVDCGMGWGGGVDRGMGGSIDRREGGMDKGLGNSMGMGMTNNGELGWNTSMDRGMGGRGVDREMGGSLDRIERGMDRGMGSMGRQPSNAGRGAGYGIGDSVNNTGRSSEGSGMNNNNSGGISRRRKRKNSMENEMGGMIHSEKRGSMTRVGRGVERGEMGDSHGMGMRSSVMEGQSNSRGSGFESPGHSGGMFGGGSLGIQRSDSIIVRNLAIDCNWNKLEDMFSHAGDIKYAAMKERGVGLIR